MCRWQMAKRKDTETHRFRRSEWCDNELWRLTNECIRNPQRARKLNVWFTEKLGFEKCFEKGRQRHRRLRCNSSSHDLLWRERGSRLLWVRCLSLLHWLSNIDNLILIQYLIFRRRKKVICCTTDCVAQSNSKPITMIIKLYIPVFRFHFFFSLVSLFHASPWRAEIETE